MITSTELVVCVIMGIVFGFLLSFIVFYRMSKLIAKKMEAQDKSSATKIEPNVKVMAYCLFGLVGILGAGLGAWMGALLSMVIIGLGTAGIVYLTIRTPKKKNPQGDADSFQMLLDTIEKKSDQETRRP